MPGKEQPKPQGKTIYNPKAGRLIFMASNLPPAPPEKAYELWLVPKQGAPVPAGTFLPDARGNAMIMESTMPAGMEPQSFRRNYREERGFRYSHDAHGDGRSGRRLSYKYPKYPLNNLPS